VAVCKQPDGQKRSISTSPFRRIRHNTTLRAIVELDDGAYSRYHALPEIIGTERRWRSHDSFILARSLVYHLAFPQAYGLTFQLQLHLECQTAKLPPCLRCLPLRRPSHSSPKQEAKECNTSANDTRSGSLDRELSPQIPVFCSLAINSRDFPKWIVVHAASRRVCHHDGFPVNLSGTPTLPRRPLRLWMTSVAHERSEIAALTGRRSGEGAMA
jgi:hypothetical protein